MIDTIGMPELSGLIPHRGKMLMLSRVTRYDGAARALEAEFDITPECLFYDEAAGGLPAWCAFECAAQAIGALSGLRRREDRTAPKPGVILSVSKLCAAMPVLGGTITISVHEEYRMDNIFTFRCLVGQGAERALEATLTVMEVDDMRNLYGGING